jgi:hypothetical protein
MERQLYATGETIKKHRIHKIEKNRKKQTNVKIILKILIEYLQNNKRKQKVMRRRTAQSLHKAT